MKRLLARRPSPAMVVALVALVCALRHRLGRPGEKQRRHQAAADVKSGSPYQVIFDLPPGFRPADKTVLTFPNLEGEEVISIQGSNVTKEGTDFSGAVVLSAGGSDNFASLNGITFRAES